MMLDTVMNFLGLNKYHHSGDESAISRRVYPRRSCDQCVGLVDGKAHPVLDWSPGGIRVFTDPRPVAVGQEMDIVLKFHLRNELISVQHRAQVVRKAQDNVSMQFLPLPADVRKTFQHVIDDFNAREFANSQA
jgi:hypothetical protein